MGEMSQQCRHSLALPILVIIDSSEDQLTLNARMRTHGLQQIKSQTSD